MFYDCTPIIITEDDVLKRLNKLNVNKSEGPDLIHPRVIYEIRHEIVPVSYTHLTLPTIYSV